MTGSCPAEAEDAKERARARPSRRLATAVRRIPKPYLKIGKATLKRAEDHLGVAARGLGDRAPEGPLGLRPRGQDRPPADQLAEHDGHLELGEGGAEAAAHAAAERDPRVGAGRAVEEALGQEALGLGVDLGVA